MIAPNLVGQPMDGVHTEIDGLDVLLERLPPWVQDHVLEHQEDVEDVVMDLGCPLALNLKKGFVAFDKIIEKSDIETLKYALKDVADDGRTGIDGTLHRISVVRRRARGGEGTIIGATIRIARVTMGLAEPLRPYLNGGNFIILGPPKRGKTTLLRDAIRIIGGWLGPKLWVIDSSNEIAGFADVKHWMLGYARRLQVPGPEFQTAKITEALANHSAAMVILDEVKRLADAEALESGSKTGVNFGATCHAETFDEALERSVYQPLFGNVNLRERVKYTRSSFDTIIEIKDWGKFVVYQNADEVINRHLNGEQVEGVRVGAWS